MDNVKLDVCDWGTVKHPKTGQSEIVKKYTWTNDKSKVKIEVISYGVIIKSINIPDKHGKVQDVALGFDSIEGYLRSDNPYFGALIGRVANRVGNGIIKIQNEQINVTKNHGNKHQLHGGFIGFDKYNWKNCVNDDEKSVTFSHLSLDGDEGYPGDLITTCTVSLDDENKLCLVMKAHSTQPTPVNLTNHSYFNLAGHETGAKEIYNHVVSINADKITETDGDSIPSGKLLEVGGTPYDLRIPTKLGPALAKLSTFGFDDNFCVTKTTKNQEISFLSRVFHENSGRFLEVYSNQPGVQFYTSNYMPDPNDAIHPEGNKKLSSPNKAASIPGKCGAKYQKHGAFCLETQKFPDATNHSNFPDTIVVPGKEYNHIVIYKFGVQNV
uniref:Aldose 1-epimerase n=1 Tax=Culicoides sonorensis TaxID=179676 RepID=A0A336MR65_CULSO